MSPSPTSMLDTDDRSGRRLWADRVAATPDRLFLVDVATGRRWTYAEAEDEVARTAGGLAALGVHPGDRVLVGMGNRVETVFAHLAVARLGAVCVPLQETLTFAELLYQIEHSEAAVLLAEGPTATTLRPRLDELVGLRAVVLEDTGDAQGAVAVHALAALREGPAVAYAELPGVDADAPATILYTSGSTGRPKGVIIPAGAFGAAGRAFAERFGVTGEDTYYLPLTLAHAIGALTAQAMTVVTGGALALAPRFSPRRFWEDVATGAATYSILFPAHLNLVLEAGKQSADGAATSLRLMITHQFVHAFRDRFGVELATVWGMTETGAMSSGSDPGEIGGEGFIGHPMVGVDIGIFDDAGTRLGPGEVGEIRLRHRYVMHGYLKDEAATAATLVDGWVRSGDAGEVDEQGRLFFRGRQKDVIKRAGENISPEEVETALAAVPGVVESLVFGVPDALRSEEVAAVVVRSGTLTDAELLDAAAHHLARWKLPRYVRLVDQPLPRLGNGKIDRASVRRAFDPADFTDRTASPTA